MELSWIHTHFQTEPRFVLATRLDDRGVGVRVPVGLKIFTSPHRPDRLWDPPNLVSIVYLEALSPGLKRQGREADHSPPTSAEAKKTWIYETTPPIRLHGVVLS
jgi:hypothetical protein